MTVQFTAMIAFSRRKILISLIISTLIGCTTSDFCSEPTESVATLKFYSRVGRILSDTTVKGFSAMGMNTSDSLLYDSIDVSAFYLPLSASDTSCSFLLTFSIPDTLFITDTIDTDTLTNNPAGRINTQYRLTTKSNHADSIIVDTIPFYYYKYDTITLNYSPVLFYISQSCGFTYHYNVGSIQATGNVIDTILITSGTINTNGNENFKVLF